MKPFLDEKLLIDKTLGVAVSGGGDSLALIDYLSKNREKLCFGFVAVTVNHGIRAAEGESDAEFVVNFCKERNIDVLRFDVDALKTASENGISVEVAARILRYDCFFRAIEKGFCDLIATAHHRGDNAETILLNLLRGAGLKGVSGMQYSSYSNKIIRPLLNVSKEEIDKYLAENAVEFVTDSTNLCNEYTRNFIRNELMPKIKERFPNAEKALLRFAETARCDDEFLTKLCDEYLITVEYGAKILFCKEKPLFFRAAIKALKSIGASKDYETVHLQALYQLQFSNSGSMLNLSSGAVAYKDYDAITITCQRRKEIAQSSPFKKGVTKINSKTVKVTAVDINDNFKRTGGELYADGDKIPQNAVFRSRKQGDVFTKFGGGRKKLKDFLIDIKIPARERNSLIVLACENIILAVLGIEISDEIKIKPQTKHALKLEII